MVDSGTSLQQWPRLDQVSAPATLPLGDRTVRADGMLSGMDGNRI